VEDDRGALSVAVAESLGQDCGGERQERDVHRPATVLPVLVAASAPLHSAGMSHRLDRRWRLSGRTDAYTPGCADREARVSDQR
jgi:hypothetical protein